MDLIEGIAINQLDSDQRKVVEQELNLYCIFEDPLHNRLGIRWVLPRIY